MFFVSSKLSILMTIRQIPFDSNEYHIVWQLREDVLRKPLGLSLKNEDLSGEKDEIVFAAQEGEETVGCLLVRKLQNGSIKLRQMAIAPAHQGKGIGAELLQAAEDFALENDALFLELHARETAVSFYEKEGFHTVGERFTEVNIPHFKMVKSLSQ